MDTEIIAIIVSLLFSAFFSGMEIAYLSANRVRLSMFKTEKSWVGQIISYLLERPDKYIATMLVGNNIALVVCGGRGIAVFGATGADSYIDRCDTGNGRVYAKDYIPRVCIGSDGDICHTCVCDICVV